ncbi:MAG: hypothetical protein ACXV5Q_17430 [Frankiaceae bacterium]
MQPVPGATAAPADGQTDGQPDTVAGTDCDGPAHGDTGADGHRSAIRPLPGTPCQLFPADNAWHADISKLPLSPQSAAWLTSTGASSGRLLHPDFGPSGDPAHPWYGIPYTVVPGTQVKTALGFDYADESDRIGYPVDANTKIEWGSDRHALILDKDVCRLYELLDFDLASRHAGSGAT